MKILKITATFITWILITIITPYLIKCLFINPDTRNTLIDYMGSIYSGLMTIVGVAATIIYEKNERNKDIELEYRPQLKLEECDYKDLTTNGQIDIVTESEKFFGGDSLHKCLVIKNIGRGEMLDVKLSDVKVELIKEKLDFTGYLSTGRNYDEIGKEDSISYNIVVPRRGTNTAGSSKLYNVSIKISFYGCLHKTKYNYLISFCIDKKYGVQHDKLYNYKIIKL